MKEAPEPPMAIKFAFVFWQGHLQAFFIGLLFFLSGVFAHRSLERRGAGGFARERFQRLAMPALLYMVVIHPFMVYVLLGNPHVANRPSLGILYRDYVMSGRVLSGNGPLWFALALLAFSMVLAVWSQLGRVEQPAGRETKPSPGLGVLLGFGVALVVATFLVRLVQPIGMNIFNFQLCFFPQYIAAFVAGVAAGRHGWLDLLATSRSAKIAGWLGLLGGPLLLAFVAWLGGPPPERGPSPYDGGWTVQAFGLAVWEQLAGLALGLGLVSLFRRRFNMAERFARWLSERAFGVYVLHAPIMVALTPMLRPLGGNPFSRMVVLTVLTLIASFAAADLAKRTPGLKKIL